MQLNIESRGHVCAEVIKNGVVTQRYEFENIVLDRLWSQLNAKTSMFVASIGIGTGTATPSYSDSGLANDSGKRATTTSSGDVAELVGTSYIRSFARYTAKFSVGQATGNWTELGLVATSSGGFLTRALFKNQAGDPITVTVLADEELQITYDLEFRIPNQDYTGSFTVTNGGSHSFIARNGNANQFGHSWMLDYHTLFTYVWYSPTITLPTFGNGASGTGLDMTETQITGGIRASRPAGAAESYKTIGINNNSYNGVPSASVMFYEFTPPIPKTALETFSIDLGISYGRAV